MDFLKESFETVRKARHTLRAIDNPLRQRILTFISENQGTTVTNIYKKLRIEQSVASQMLGILRKEGIVTTERNGREIHYQVNESQLKRIVSTARQLAIKN